MMIVYMKSYQCAFNAFERAGYSRTDAVRLMRSAVQLAIEAKLEHEQSSTNSKKTNQVATIALSLGPYGATLHPAQEFDGFYPPPYGPKEFIIDGENCNTFSPSEVEKDHMAEQALEDFHFERLKVFASDETVWKGIDLLVFETVPLVREIRAIRGAMKRLAEHLQVASLSANMKPWWVSTVWPGGIFPQERTPGGSRLDVDDVIFALLSNHDESPAPHGIGINCTELRDLKMVVKKFGQAVTNMHQIGKIYLVLYPNGGNEYDGVNHTWKITEDTTHSSSEWGASLARIVRHEMETGFWRGLVAGGCCKTGPSHIKSLQSAVLH